MSEPISRRRGLPERVRMRHSHHFVDELAARHETPIGKLAPLSEISMISVFSYSPMSLRNWISPPM